jgi:hypothetical protein
LAILRTEDQVDEVLGQGLRHAIIDTQHTARFLQGNGGALGNSWPPNVPSAPIGRTAMGRLTQGGARVAGLPWAGIPAHRWCARGHQCDLGWSDQSKHQRRRSCNNAHSEALLLLS